MSIDRYRGKIFSSIRQMVWPVQSWHPNIHTDIHTAKKLRKVYFTFLLCFFNILLGSKIGDFQLFSMKWWGYMAMISWTSISSSSLPSSCGVPSSWKIIILQFLACSSWTLWYVLLPLLYTVNKCYHFSIWLQCLYFCNCHFLVKISISGELSNK